jgi:hypothetical protein
MASPRCVLERGPLTRLEDSHTYNRTKLLVNKKDIRKLKRGLIPRIRDDDFSPNRKKTPLSGGGYEVFEGVVQADAVHGLWLIADR